MVQKVYFVIEKKHPIFESMYKLLLKLLFLFDPERVHYLTLNSLKLLVRIPWVYGSLRKIFYIHQPVVFLGITFPNRVGLAAGFDKNAKYLKEFQAMGFGHVEIGTVTPKPQSGNDKPRLFRLVKDEAIINRMGFNNDGADVIAARLRNRPKDLIVGGNIGKNKVTANEDAKLDYEICFSKLYDVVDYFVVNVSSPNTPNLRALQDKGPLREILMALVQLRIQFVQSGKMTKPILLKIAPDLTHEQLDDVVDLVTECNIEGLVATNTTISRAGLKTNEKDVVAIGAGGLSGKPVHDMSTDVLQYIYQKSKGSIPLIGVGGIDSKQTANNKLNAGATLVQVYSGLIYKGPGLVKEIASINL